MRLALTPDAIKDQTYFLAQLSPAQLARTMFPLGALTKPQVRVVAVVDCSACGFAAHAEVLPVLLVVCMVWGFHAPPLRSSATPPLQVRALAVAAGLATSGRKDSQGICFLGKVKFGEFVKEHLGVWRGPLVEAENGAVLGAHEGYWFYTVGQRGGIKLPGGPW